MYKNIFNVTLLLLALITLSSSMGPKIWLTIPSDSTSEYLYIDTCFENINGDFQNLIQECQKFDSRATVASIKNGQIQAELFTLINNLEPEAGISDDVSDCTKPVVDGILSRIVRFGGIFTNKVPATSGPSSFSKIEYIIEWTNNDPFTPLSLSFAPIHPFLDVQFLPEIFMHILTGLIHDGLSKQFAAIMCQRDIRNTCYASDCVCLYGKSCAVPTSKPYKSIIDIIPTSTTSQCCELCRNNRWCLSWSYVKRAFQDHQFSLNNIRLNAKDCVLYSTECYISDDPALQSGFIQK